ncbi:hypothetical protein F4820DRAFT_440811, partial [Hypoxylon rubiginosum]
MGQRDGLGTGIWLGLPCPLAWGAWPLERSQQIMHSYIDGRAARLCFDGSQWKSSLSGGHCLASHGHCQMDTGMHPTL